MWREQPKGASGLRFTITRRAQRGARRPSPPSKIPRRPSRTRSDRQALSPVPSVWWRSKRECQSPSAYPVPPVAPPATMQANAAKGSPARPDINDLHESIASKISKVNCNIGFGRICFKRAFSDTNKDKRVISRLSCRGLLKRPFLQRLLCIKKTFFKSRSGAALPDMHTIAVFPVSGWWKYHTSLAKRMSGTVLS